MLSAWRMASLVHATPIQSTAIQSVMRSLRSTFSSSSGTTAIATALHPSLVGALPTIAAAATIAAATAIATAQAATLAAAATPTALAAAIGPAAVAAAPPPPSPPPTPSPPPLLATSTHRPGPRR